MAIGMMPNNAVIENLGNVNAGMAIGPNLHNELSRATSGIVLNSLVPVK